MRATAALVALVLTVPHVSARCIVGHVPAAMCTTGFYAGQFGAFYREAKPADRDRVTVGYLNANGCALVERAGLEVFPTGGRYSIDTRAPLGAIEVVRVEADGLPPAYVAARNLTGDCRRR